MLPVSVTQLYMFLSEIRLEAELKRKTVENQCVLQNCELGEEKEKDLRTEKIRCVVRDNSDIQNIPLELAVKIEN